MVSCLLALSRLSISLQGKVQEKLKVKTLVEKYYTKSETVDIRTQEVSLATRVHIYYRIYRILTFGINDKFKYSILATIAKFR